MAAVRLFSKEEVEKQLWQRHCRRVKEYETSALWKTREGFHFIVPQEGPDKQCDEYSLREILEEIDRRNSEAKKR